MREDFNHDNAAIDAALHTQAAQTAVAVKAVEEKISLVRLFQTTLTSAAASLSIDLSDIDLSQYIELELYTRDLSTTETSGQALYITPSDGSESTGMSTPHVSKSGKYNIRAQLMDGENLLFSGTQHNSKNTSTTGSSISKQLWTGHPLADVKTITLSLTDGSITAGTTIVIYGRKA